MRNNVKSKKKRVEQKGNREQMEIGCYSLGDLPTTDYKRSKYFFFFTIRARQNSDFTHHSSVVQRGPGRRFGLLSVFFARDLTRQFA